MTSSPRPHQIDPSVFPSNEEIAEAFRRAQGLTANRVWHPFGRREGGQCRMEYAFWLDNDAWRELCINTQSVGGEQIQAIIARGDPNDEVTRSCLIRLKSNEVTEVHLAAAVLAGVIAQQLPKPFQAVRHPFSILIIIRFK